jgi:aminomethyltransferase
VGAVTSGNFSPVLGHAIAMAFLPPDVAEGTAVELDVRGRTLAATVVPLPFVRG